MPTATPSLSSELLSRAQVAELLGVREQTLAVWQTTHRYDFHKLCLKIGAKVRYRRQDVEQWIESRRLVDSDQRL